MRDIINNLKKLNEELPEDINSEAYYDDLLKRFFEALEASEKIMIEYSGTETYSRLKHKLKDVINESEKMNHNFADYPFESKIKLIEMICEEYEYINLILEKHYIKMGVLSEYWRYDYPDIYRHFRNQLVINPEDGKVNPISDSIKFFD